MLKTILDFYNFLKMQYVDEFTKMNNIYTFTNEDFRRKFTNFDFKGSSVVTVAASGDQAINMVLNGAEKIFAFDINHLQLYFMRLKIAAQRTLSKDDFLKFIRSIELGDVDTKVLKEVSGLLIYEERLLWQMISFVLKKSKQTIYIKQDINHLYNNPYLDSDKYSKTQKLLEKAEFTYSDCNLSDLDKTLAKTGDGYDYIYLSNIFGYYDQITESLEEFREMVLNLRKYLKDGGILMAGYHYYYGPDDWQYYMFDDAQVTINEPNDNSNSRIVYYYK